MPEDVLSRIRTELSRIEKEERITILYACESGSRAWGFESEDSDYDVRFIYLHPTPWYLSIQKKRDVIELFIQEYLDISGWDVRKTLRLLRKSNPPLLEWLQSPIVYKKHSSFVGRLRDIMAEYYSPHSCMFHYLHMAQNNYRQYLKGDVVWTKKYFYVLRPVLACLWIEQDRGIVPTEFEKIVNGVVENPELRREIDKLLEAKRKGAELDQGPANKVISSFLKSEIERIQAGTQKPPRTRDPAILDNLFYETLKEVNGDIKI